MHCLFVAPNSSFATYQELAIKVSAIEPPTWALLLAESCRSLGFDVSILDADAERLEDEKASQRIVEMAPKLVCFVVYGQNPNSGTTNMSGAIRLATELKTQDPNTIVVFVGSHVSAAPQKVLANSCVDIVLLNEGVYALHNLLRSRLEVEDLRRIRGIAFKEDNRPILNEPEVIVPQSRMDIDLPGYAWDLLPYKIRPLDLYRAHNWHAGFDEGKRTPFAAIYTSLGCRYGCDFCMINILNRQSNEAGISAADSRVMRHWSPQLIVRELRKLANLGVNTVRISDEMFFLSPQHFEPLITSPEIKELQLSMWAYARVDTVRDRYLESFVASGINWLALGIESGAQEIRRDVSKGSFKDVNIRDVVTKIRSYGINVIANYIFGFEHERKEDMQATLDLALDLNTEMANMYPCQALPGSPMYVRALNEGREVPRTFEEFGFLGYESKPMATNFLTSEEVIRFRDDAWHTYFGSENYLSLVERKFGMTQRTNVENMAKIRLKRKILGD